MCLIGLGCQPTAHKPTQDLTVDLPEALSGFHRLQKEKNNTCDQQPMSIENSGKTEKGPNNFLFEQG